MKPILLALAFVPALPLLSAQVRPQEPQEENLAQVLEQMIRRLDKDGDERVSREEFPGRAIRFRRLDKDGNGFLDTDDLPQADAPAPATTSTSAPLTQEALNFFEQKIRPVLADNCYRCHSSQADKIKGGLVLDSLEGLLAGGGTGAAIVPGDPDASLLITAVRYTDEDLEMPPKKPLSAEAVKDLELWVKMGASWPDVQTQAELGKREHGIDIEADKEWWAFKAPQAHEVPATKNEKWAWDAIDRFLLAEMEAEGVTPVADADDRKWLRRVSFDLSGLQPTPEEIAAFEADNSSERYAQVVDRLLASPRYGERWGRHWLDVARYAESSGKDSNVVYPHAWRYRDWVIEALEADMPYDKFVAAQIAGDLLPAESEVERAQNSIATGYLALGAKSHNERERRQFAADLADEQIDALSQGLMGITVSCARCHDHKFDPIPTEDYYALQGIFQSTVTLYGTVNGRGNRYPSELMTLPAGEAFADGPTMTSDFRKLLERLRKQAQSRFDGDGPMMRPGARDDDAKGGDARPMEMDDDAQRRAQAAADRARMRNAKQALTDLDSILARFDEQGRPTAANRVAMGVREGRGRDAALLVRGEIATPGAKVPRGFPQVLTNENTPVIKQGSGRLELAEWLGSASNPLTARVWVNRVWLNLFGRGIVGTPNNFGKSGQEPTHPELLDWLALTFVEEGWSTKALVRRIVLSHAYRLASTGNATNDKLDPEVALLWRMPERRLDAEAIRDSMLFASGTLDLNRPEGSTVGLFEGSPRQDQVFAFIGQPSKSRSVYLPLLRDRVPEALEVFDAADPTFVTGEREETNVATQALYLMNDSEVLAAADALSARLLAHEGDQPARIQLGFELVLGREASGSELRAVKAFLKDYTKLAEPEPEPETKPKNARRARDRRARAQTPAPLSPKEAAWSAFAQALFQSAEFRYAG